MDITRFLLFFGFFLAHWAPATIATYSYNCPQRNVEFLFNIDVSSSYYNQRLSLQYKMSSIIEELERNYSGAKFGLASFSDKKTSNRDTSSDYCYITRIRIGEKERFLRNFGTWLERDHQFGGMNQAESQLDALFHGSLSGTVGWSAKNDDSNDIPILRVMILMTDAEYSKAGYALETLGHHFAPHDNRREPACTTLDYPTVPMVRNAMITAGVVPMIITNKSSIKLIYEELLNQMRVGGTVILEEEISEGAVHHGDDGVLTAQILEHVQELYCETSLPPPITETEDDDITARDNSDVEVRPDEGRQDEHPLVVSSTTPAVKVAEANPAAPSHNGDEESENSPPLTDDADGKEEKKKSNVAAIAAASGGVFALAMGGAGYATYAARKAKSIAINTVDGFGDQILEDGRMEAFADFDATDYL